ncbi:MAG: TrpB-like pyridoxal phosphate-dependent enzyme [Candidatus Omnitrophica bacterium]|nr:TrpB-like pyridoxal phosphate-dependent enzyme [Candidatus Omnitrophota bacterium]
MDKDKVLLSQKDIPTRWYNILPDLPEPLPPYLHPGTGKPLQPKDLAPIFPMSLIRQELSSERWIDIPDGIRDVYRIYRPTPLIRAVRLEKALKTKSRIYYKNESVSPAGSHKLNTAIAQAYYNKKEGVKRICTETGAGQWGSALSFACNLLKLKCTVYMVKASYYQKPYRKSLMHIWGSEVFASPTKLTRAGRSVLKENPNSPGSLGIAISEAVEDAASHDDAKYSLGSVLNHVLMHQTIVGLEAKKQLEMIGEKPDVLIGCVGGGSNFAGFVFPFVRDKLKGRKIRMIGVEPTACPTLTKGAYMYDFGDIARLTPLVKMYTLGHSFVPEAIHAGGLRYHGAAPVLCALVKEGLIEAKAYHQNPVFEAGVLFARTEGFLPAPETCHALKCVIEEAKKNKEQCIVFNYSGHGHFDLSAYDAYLEGKLGDYDHPEKKIKEALNKIPRIGE